MSYVDNYGKVFGHTWDQQAASLKALADAGITATDLLTAAQKAKNGAYATVNESSYNAAHGPQAVDRTGVTATDVALQAALDAAAADVQSTVTNAYDGSANLNVGRTFVIPDGKYKLANPLVWPAGINIEVSDRAQLTASAAMAQMISTPVGTYHQGESIKGGIWDCNDFATTGLSLGWFSDMAIKDMLVLNFGSYGMVLGDPAATTTPYEARVENFRTKRKRGNAIPSGSRGLWLRNCTDAKLLGGVINGAETGTRVDTGGNLIYDYHCWNYGSVAQMVTCFDDNNYGNIYLLCYADSPSAYGWRFRTGSGSVQSGRAYMNVQATDNIATVVGTDVSTAGYNIFGLRIDAASVAHRWALDFGGADLDYCDIVGVSQGANACASYAMGGSGVRSRLRALTLGNAIGTALVNARRRSGALGDWLQFNDTSGTSTKGFRVGYTGSPTMPQYTTATRPAASDVPYGWIFDTTLGKPIWSDGTTWRDATGTAV